MRNARNLIETIHTDGDSAFMFLDIIKPNGTIF